MCFNNASNVKIIYGSNQMMESRFTKHNMRNGKVVFIIIYNVEIQWTFVKI